MCGGYVHASVLYKCGLADWSPKMDLCFTLGQMRIYIHKKRSHIFWSGTYFSLDQLCEPLIFLQMDCYLLQVLHNTYVCSMYIYLCTYICICIRT